MKRLFILLLIPVLCLCACKKNQPAPGAATVPGAVQTVGSITLFLPEGRTAVPDDETQVRLYKGEANTGTYIKLQLYRGAQAYLPPQSTCENVQELAARTWNVLTWSGFSGTKATGTGVGTVTYLVTQSEGNNFLATLWYDEGATPISPEDAEVQAILGSLSAPAAQEPAATDPTGETLDEGPTDETAATQEGEAGETGESGETAQAPNEFTPDEEHS